MNRCKNPTLIIFAMLLLSLLGPVRADTLFGLYAGAGTWEQSVSGQVVSDLSTLDVEQDLALQDDRNRIYYLAIEHGVPVLPNLRLQHFGLQVGGQNQLSRAVEFNGQGFAADEQVDTQVDLSQSDAVFYYQLLDSAISLDLGFAVSRVQGQVAVSSLASSSVADIEEYVPMLYSRVRINLPLGGLWLGAEGQGASYENSHLLEYNAQLGWESGFGLGLEAGYRAIEMELEAFDAVEQARLDIKGPYAAINYHF